MKTRRRGSLNYWLDGEFLVDHLQGRAAGEDDEEKNKDFHRSQNILLLSVRSHCSKAVLTIILTPISQDLMCIVAMTARTPMASPLLTQSLAEPFTARRTFSATTTLPIPACQSVSSSNYQLQYETCL